jgi:SAM-dependent methyltransferase
MSGADRLRWDEIYGEMNSAAYPPPDPLLFDFTSPIEDDEEHRALDLACGMGQNGLWLASQGYVVDLLDVSRIALLRAQAEATLRGLRELNILPVDLDQHILPADHYELVAVFRYLKRDMFAALRHTIRPGGRILYESFNRRYLQLVPGFNTNYLLEVGELLGYFADWNVLTYAEDSHLSRIVAVKPT